MPPFFGPFDFCLAIDSPVLSVRPIYEPDDCAGNEEDEGNGDGGGRTGEHEPDETTKSEGGPRPSNDFAKVSVHLLSPIR